MEELVVTAQKRPENIQDVPLSIMAVSEKALMARGVDDVRRLERVVPGLRLEPIVQVAGIAVRIRGFGSASNAAIDPSVAPYIDGVYLPRPGAILSTFLDVETIEVLRGPQGTLFGRNATAGALSVRTRAPDPEAFAARVAGQVGRFGERQADGFVNVPLNDRLTVRLALLANETDGYIKSRLNERAYGRKDLVEGRLSALWKVTDDLTWIGRIDYAHTTGDGANLNQVDTATASAAQLAAFSTRLGAFAQPLGKPPSYTVSHALTNLNLADHQYGLTSDLSYSAGSGFTVRLINSYRDWQHEQSDGDGIFTPLELLSRDGAFDSASQSHELQVISPENALGGRLRFVAGLYYFHEDYAVDEVVNITTAFCSFPVALAAPALVAGCNAAPKQGATFSHFTQSAKSRAVYFQSDFALTRRIDLTLGARQTWDRKSGTYLQTLSNPAGALIRAPESVALRFKDSRPSWRAGLKWRATPDVMAFVTYSTGYKSGGLNSAGVVTPLNDRRLFDSETSEDWEVGLKSVLFDRRLLLNVTAFRTDLDAFQERAFDGVSFIVRNAGSIRAEGVEVEGQVRPTASITLDFAVAYLDSIFTENLRAPGLPGCTGAANSCPTVQDLTGRRSTFAPQWTANVGGEYASQPFAGGFVLTLRLDGSYTSSYYSLGDLNPQSLIDEVTLYSGRLTLTSPDASWNLSVFGENLTGERYFRSKIPQSLDGLFGVRVPSTGATLLRGYVGTPRTWGVRAVASF